MPATIEQETTPLIEFLVFLEREPEPASVFPLEFDLCGRDAYNHLPNLSTNEELPHFNTDSSMFSCEISFGLGQWEYQKCTFHTEEERLRPNCAACSPMPDL
jgi:hypothetical protein